MEITSQPCGAERRNGTMVDSQPLVNSSKASLLMEEPSPEYKTTAPEYEALVQSARLGHKFNIQPREDEGREKLPSYSCAISLENVFMRKMELEGAVHRAHDRTWYRVYAVLQGTALTFHKWKGKGLFNNSNYAMNENPDFPTGAKKTTFLKSYNLRHAECGVAIDYFKKRYVIRVRAETDQFLLSCMRIETFVEWLQSLFAAIGLAPPLDDREIPRDLSIPRPRRRRIPMRLPGEEGEPTEPERNTEMVRQQYEIVRRYYPWLADAEPGDAIAQSAVIEAIRGSGEAGILNSSPPNARTRTASVPVIPPPLRSSSPGLSRPATAPSSGPRPSIDLETGKWRPEHNWSATYDMVYAKRCLSVLTHRSPRKSKYIIINGKQWIVDWATGKLTRVAPPDYGEAADGVSDGRTGGELRIGQNGTLVHV